MDTLQSMFPGVEYETLEIVLESQEGDLEGAIEALLEMAKDTQPTSSGDEGGGGGGGGRNERRREVSHDPVAFEVPHQHPIIQRDTQIRTDEMIARRMQEQIFSEALQEQTPTCFTPITGMLSGYNRRQDLDLGAPATNVASSYNNQTTTLSDTVSNVWNTVSTVGQSVTKTIVDTASTWMAGQEQQGAGQGPADDGGAAFGHGGGDGGGNSYMNEDETQHTSNIRLADTSVSQRRKSAQKNQFSKKSD